MTFGKAVKFNVLHTSRIIHNLSNEVFISNNIINTKLQTGGIITFSQSEEGNLLSETHEDTEIDN